MKGSSLKQFVEECSSLLPTVCLSISQYFNSLYIKKIKNIKESFYKTGNEK